MRSIFTNPLPRQKYSVVSAFMLLFSLLASTMLHAQVSGTVFRDFNGNGQRDGIPTTPLIGAGEPGVPGVTVTAYFGSSIVSTTTNSSGAYSFPASGANSIPNGTKTRIEFSSFPIADFSGPSGSGSGTSVQFVTAGAATNSVNLGLNYPADFVGDPNPYLVTSCFENGTPLNGGTSANDPFIVSIPFNPTGDGTITSENVYLSKGSEVGSTWGIAYQRSSKFIFTSAFLKRHSGFGSGGPGAIYKIDVSQSPQVTTLFVDLNADLGVSAGTDPRDNTPANSLSLDKTTPNHDAAAFGLVGKMSLGDLDISDDEKTLWVINTFDQKLYELPIGSPAVKPTTKIAHTLPNPGCTNGVFRPWAVKFWRGKVYVGGVCTAENGGTSADLKAYIYSFVPGDANPNNFTEVYHFDLNYNRGYTSISSSSDMTSAAWQPWVAQWSDITNPAPGAATFGQTIHPQPILSDIEFDVDGSMILGFMDRIGHQTGNANYSPDPNDLGTYEGTSAGDLLRVGKNSNGTYQLENNATVNGITTNGSGQSPSQGPGNGEYYWQDMYGLNADKNYPNGIAGGGHQEISIGGLAFLSGSAKVVETVFDPVNDYRAGGVRWFNNTDGSAAQSYQIFGLDAGGGSTTFGKANGLGDLELLLKPAPIELGNRLWKDLNNDGIQDPNEPALIGVSVGLYTSGGTLIANATTDGNGNYIFSSGQGTSTNSLQYNLAIAPNTDYQIRVTNLGSDPSVSGLSLTSVSPTPGESGTTNTGATLANNDAKLVNNIPTIVLKTGDFGANNHTYDVAIATCTAPTSITVGSNSPVCVGGSISLLATPVGGSGTFTYDWSGPSGYTSTTQNPTISPTTVANSGTYTITVSTGTGCSATNTVAVVVSANPTAAATGATVCVGATINLTSSGGTSYAWTGPSGFSSSSQNPNIASAVLANGGVYSVTVSNANGCTATATANVVVNPNPTAAATGATVCVGATINLASSGGTSYAWTGPSSFSSTTQNPSIASAVIANGGTYSVTVTNGNGCTATATAIVVVNPNPTALATGATVCVGGTINLLASGGTSYTWTGPNTFSSSTQNPSIANATNAMAGTYTVVVTNANGCTATITANVVVNPNPTATATGATVCVGGTINLQGSGGTSYNWTGPNGFSSTQQNPSIANATSVAAGIYTVLATNGNGCTATAIANVNVSPAPTITTITVNSPISVGGTINLSVTATNVATYAWAGPNGFSSTTQNPSINNATGAMTGVYTVTVASSLGCTATGTVSVVVNANPTASATGATVCVGATINLASAGGTSYSWTGPNGFTSTAQNPSIASAILANDGIYTVLVTNATGGTATATAGVMVYANPTAAATGATVCVGATINLASSGGTSYAWTGPNAFASTQQNPAIINATLSMAGTYSVFVTDANGCTATATTPVVVNPLPTASATGATVCVGGTINLLASGGTSYTWTGPNTFSSSTQNPSIANATNAMAGTYTVVVTNANGCTATTTANVAVNAGTTANATGATICVGATINLQASGGSSYAWAGPNGFTSTTQNPAIANATLAMDGIYTVTVLNGSGCSGTATIGVTVNANPTASATGATVCVGATINLQSSGGTSYAWTGPNSFSSSTQNPSIASAVIANGGTYSVTVTNGNGCTATATAIVVVNPNPTAVATGATVCVGGTINLLASGGSTYSWTGPNTFSSITQNPSIANATNAMAGIYTVTVSNTTGCTASTTANVAVNASITASATGATVCVGGIINLGVSGGSSYAWTGPNGFTSTTQNPVLTNATTLMAGVYTVNASSGAGCTAVATANVVVNPNPTASATGATVCVGGTLNMSASGGTSYAWTGPSAFSSTLQNPSILNATATNAGIYTVVVTNANGCTASATANASVSTLPTITTVSVNSPISVGGTINLSVTATNATTYAWTGPNGYTSATQNPSISNATTAMTGVYTITVASSLGCTATGTVSVVVNVNPTAAATGSTICAGATITLQATGGTSYSWTGPNTFSSTQQNPSISNGTVSMAGVYTVTVSNATGGTATATASVVVNANPTAAATGATVCVGQTINLSSSGGTNYTWTGPNSFSSTQQNPSITTAVIANGGIYNVTVTNGNGCTATTTVNVVVNPNPTAAATGATVCVGGAINLLASGGSTYSWTGPNSFSSTLQNPSIANATNAMAGVYTVTVSSTAGCTASTTVNVAVNASITASATGATVCIGGAINLGVTGGSSYSWTGPNGFASTAQNPSIANATSAMAGVYTVNASSGAGCTASATANVVVNPNPTITTVSVNSPVLAGSTINLSVTATNASTYAWSGPNGFTSTTQNPSIPNATTNMAGVYTVTVASSSGCTATGTVSVVVNVVNPTASATGATVCVGAMINLQSSGGTSYAWSGPNAYTSTQQNPSIASATLTMGGIYTVTVSNATGGTATATASVIVNANPTATATGATVCVGSTINLASSGGTSYVWTGPSSFTSSSQNPSITPAVIANGGVYSVTVTNGNGCTSTATANVVVNPLPTITTINSNSPVTVGSTINLTVATSANVTGYSWTGPNGFTSTQQNPNISNATVAMAGVYTVTVTNNLGCTATSTVNVNIISCVPPTITNISSNSPNVGGTISLAANATNASTYAWAGPNGFSSTTQNPSINNATTAMSGVYTVTVTASAGTCTATATIRVTVNPTSTCNKPNAGPDIEFCEPGQSVDLPDALTGQNWQVGPNNPANASIIPSAGAVSGMTANGTYMFILFGGNNCADTVLVTRRPKPNAGPDQTVCSPTSSVQLSTSGNWSGMNNNPANASVTSAGLVTGMTVAGTYQFIITSTAGCMDTVAVVVKAKPNAGADQTGTNAVCSNTNTTTLTGTPVGGTWSVATGNPATASITNLGVVTGLTANGNYTFIYTLNGCADSVIVERKDCTTPTCIKPNAGPDMEICSNVSSVKLPTATTGQTWSAQTGNPVSVTIDPTTGLVTGMTRNGDYHFILTSAGTGTNCTDTVTVGRGVIDYPAQTVCSPQVTFQLPTKVGITWTAATGNPAAATVNNSGSVNGMITDGIYKFIVSDGVCQDTVIVERKACTPLYDLSLRKRISKQKPALNEIITYTIVVKNEGNLPATGVEVKDTLNGGVIYQSSSLIHGTGTYNSTTGAWNIGSIAIGDSAVMNILVKVVQAGVWFNTAEISKMNEKDVDSTPNNGVDTEDDIDRVCFSVPIKICSSQKIVLTAPVGFTNVEWFNGTTSLGKSATYTVTASGSYSYVATNGTCSATGCCALEVVVENCCQTDICTPYTVEKKKK